MFLKEVKLSNWAVSICMWTPQKENIISDEIVLGIQFNNNKIHLGCIGLDGLLEMKHDCDTICHDWQECLTQCPCIGHVIAATVTMCDQSAHIVRLLDGIS